MADDTKGWTSVKSEKVGCKENDWISVNDRLPEHMQRVLVATKPGLLCDLVTSYHFASLERIGMIVNNVTHWMPLPELPDET